MNTKALCFLSIAVLMFVSRAQAAESVDEAPEFDDISDIVSLMALLDTPIESVSRRLEKLHEAPARIIIITRDDMIRHGYTSLIEVFRTLPGIDHVATYGADYYRNYFRGWRTAYSLSYVFLVDGVLFNDLYFNYDLGTLALPLSNVERIEIIYGPSSVVYGANAANGVVNIVTRSDRSQDGSSTNIQVSGEKASLDATMPEIHTIDANYFYKEGDLRFSLSARMEYGDYANALPNNRYEWSHDKYHTSRELWGAFVNNEQLAGHFASGREIFGFDARLYLGTTELGFQYLDTILDYGMEFPGDKITSLSTWPEKQLSIYLKHSADLSDYIVSQTLIRYRRDNFTSGDSSTVERYDNEVYLYYFQSLNYSISLLQNFQLDFTEDWSMSAGLSIENKNLSKGYLKEYGPSVSPDELDLDTYDWPTVLPNDAHPEWQRRKPNVVGSYANLKWQPFDNHSVFVGGRLDYDPLFDPVSTLRLGYVARSGEFVAKLLWGQSYSEPSSRQMFGAWSAMADNAQLAPERSSTLEAVVSYTLESVEALVDVYSVRIEDAIVNAGVNQNRKILGADLQLRTLYSFNSETTLRGYINTTYLITASEMETADDGTSSWVTIGDIAPMKLWAGASLQYGDWSAALRGRWIGKRETIRGNPVGSVDPFLVLDANIRLAGLVEDSVAVSLKVQNLLDSEYYHPGISTADAGENPDNAGESLNESAGWYSSLLPQPTRTVTLNITLDY